MTDFDPYSRVSAIREFFSPLAHEQGRRREEREEEDPSFYKTRIRTGNDKKHVTSASRHMNGSSATATATATTMKDFSFIFFGCWNRDQRETVKPEGQGGSNQSLQSAVLPRDQVIQSIRRYLKKPTSSSSPRATQVLIVAGDNVYPRDDGVIEYDSEDNVNYNEQTVRDGFKMVGRLGLKHTHMVLGNHNAKLQPILDAEHRYKDMFNIMLYARTEIEAAPIHKRVQYMDEGVNFLFIDTNFRGGPRQKDSDVRDLLVFLDRHLENDMWNIVVGHEPLVYVTQKEGGKKKKVSHELHGLSKILAALLPVKRVVYMCADVHSFQAGVVTSSDDTSTTTGIRRRAIPMIVSGTGGAHPDHQITSPSSLTTVSSPSVLPSKHMKQQKHDEHEKKNASAASSYSILKQDNPYGYCVVTIRDEDEMLVDYVKVRDHVDGSSRTTRVKITGSGGVTIE